MILLDCRIIFSLYLLYCSDGFKEITESRQFNSRPQTIRGCDYSQLGSIYWDVLAGGFMWMREKLPSGKSTRYAPPHFDTICSHTLWWIHVFAHFAWLLSSPRLAEGQVRSVRLSDASRVMLERDFCVNLYLRIAPRKSANQAVAAAWLALWASVSRAACTLGDVAPGSLVSISLVKRNLCRLCWKDAGFVLTQPTRD